MCEICERHLRATGGDHAVHYITVDIDSFPIVVHGSQPGAAYNGHYRDTVYHPLVASYAVAGDYDSMHEGQRLGNGFLHACFAKDKFTRCTESNGLSKRSCVKRNASAGWWICGSTQATPTARVG